jgi:hypothetical protein
MTEPSLAFQTAIRARLIAGAGVTSLVPAASILSRSGRPEAFPCILISDGSVDCADNINDFYDLAFADLHVWTTEEGTEQVKTIVGAMRAALPVCAWTTVPGFTVPYVRPSTARFMRDPDNIHSHGILTLEATMLRRAV